MRGRVEACLIQISEFASPSHRSFAYCLKVDPKELLRTQITRTNSVRRFTICEINPLFTINAGENYTAVFRCSTGAPATRLSAASMIALASMP